MDLQQQQTDLQDIFTERTSGAPFPGPWVRVESIISQRGETWKSKALLIYHFKYILFVSSWKFSLFLEFYWLLPSICLLHDAAFCRRVGWWSCVMVTVLLKKEIGNDVSFSSIFLEAMSRHSGWFWRSLCTSWFYMKSENAAYTKWVSILLLFPHDKTQFWVEKKWKKMLVSVTPTNENDVIHGIKCGNYTICS